MIGLDDVPCPIEFTMRELAEISLAAGDRAVDLTNPQLRSLREQTWRSGTYQELAARVQVLIGIVRKIDAAIERVGDASAMVVLVDQPDDVRDALVTCQKCGYTTAVQLPVAAATSGRGPPGGG